MKKLLPSLLLLASLQASAQTAPTLIAHWDFNNGNTTDVVNQWTSAVTGTPSATVGSTGLANTALKFNQGDYLRVASNPKMNLTSWTIIATIRPDGFYAGNCEVNSIIWRAGDQNLNHYDLRYYDNAYDGGCGTHTPTKEVFTGNASSGVTMPGADWYSSHTNPNPFITTGTWYCVAAMYNAVAQTMTMFVDGKQVTKALPWPNNYNYNTSAVHDIFIGAGNDAAGAFPYFLDAAIDDIKIYDGVFTLSGDDGLPCNITVDPTDPPNPISVNNVAAKQSLQLFPNPATDNITIMVPAHMQSGQIVITNAVGAVVKQVAATQSTIDTHELPAGLYLVRIQSNKEIATGKFTIIR